MEKNTEKKNIAAGNTAAGGSQPGTAHTAAAAGTANTNAAGNAAVEREAMFGVLPVMAQEKLYGFLDAFLVLSGYCIATWSYTQGSYLATLVGFKQLLIGAFLGAILMLVIYQLPVILSVRFGIDIWVWLRAAFGPVGILIMTVTIIIINYPWYAVCGDLFASSMINLLGFTGLHLPSPFHMLLAILCVAGGTFIAYRGLSAITWTTRILVPLLFAVGAVVVIVGFTSVPFDYIMNFRPPRPEGEVSVIPYIMSVEANFAFVITLVGGMAEIPRVAKSERGGYWAGVLGQGLAGSFFVVVGAVMAIAMQYVCGEMIDDPTTMLATLATPALALCSLLLVAFANIGTQAVGAYIYGVMLRSAFRRVSYNTHITILALYGILFCIWGKIIEYFGSFLTITACIYAPLAAILFADFFFVRRQQIDLRAAYGMKGHEDVYRFTGGVNLVGIAAVVLGVAVSLAIYNPVTAQVHLPVLFYLTPTGASFIATLLFYTGMSCIAPVRNYMLGRNPQVNVR